MNWCSRPLTMIHSDAVRCTRVQIPTALSSWLLSMMRNLNELLLKELQCIALRVASKFTGLIAMQCPL